MSAASRKPRLLVTTADERTWGCDVPVLFLGEWCKRFSRRHVWSLLDSVTVPYHWDDRAKLERDYAYLQRLHEKTLLALVEFLNQYHGTRHSLRYWRILVGPWLGYFIQILFDRWEMIRRADDQYEVSSTVLIDYDPDEMVIQTMADFAPRFVSDEWNHWVYGQVIRQCSSIDIASISSPEKRVSRGVTPSAGRSNLRQHARYAAKLFLSTLSRTFSRQDYFFINSCISQQWRLEAALGQLPTFWASPPRTDVAVDAETRSRQKVSFATDDRFEILLESMLMRQIPAWYLEGYRALTEQVDSVNWPSQPKVIYTASAHNTDETFKAWAAAKVENGAKLVVGQHGGHFGIGRWVFHEDHEKAVVDRYFSWGWSTPGSHRIVPMSSEKLLSTARSLKPNPSGSMLLVLASLPRYSYWLYSLPVASQMLSYLDDQMKFAECLGPELRTELVVRLYPHDYGWDQRDRWIDRFPAIRIDSNQQSMYESISQSRLFVATYNATTFLETFAADVPTIMFWNPSLWEIRDEAQADFDELRRVGILHDSPQAAAEKVEKVWSDVAAWWTGTDVQRARQRICDRYARTSADWLSEWKSALRSVAQTITDERHAFEKI